MRAASGKSDAGEDEVPERRVSGGAELRGGERAGDARSLGGLLLTAAISAWAASLSVAHENPIDAALPLLAVVAVLLATVSFRPLLLAVPLLVAAEIAVPDESLRLLLFGVILGGAFFTTVIFAGPGHSVMPRPEEVRAERRAILTVTLAAIVLLRWIPFESVQGVREVVLLAIALAIVAVLGFTPFGAAVAIVVTLLTPAIPLRTMALPLFVLAVCVFARILGMRAFRLAWVSAAVIGLLILFFAWSGIVARGLPWLLDRRTASPAGARFIVNRALPAGASVTLPVPHGSKALVISGANVAGLSRGTALGTIEPGSIALEIGDASDWGYMRREQFYATRNRLPANPAGKLRAWGYDAWVDGAGRVAIPRGAKSIRVTAAPTLPPDASLQVEAFEWSTP